MRVPTNKYKYAFQRYQNKKTTSKGFKYPKDTKVILLAKNNFKSSPEQVEIIRRILNKSLKKKKSKGRDLNIRVSPKYACSKKPLQSRMGKGKGKPSHFIATSYVGNPIAFMWHLQHKRLVAPIKKIKHRIRAGLKKIVLNEKPHYTVIKQDQIKIERFAKYN